MTIVFGSHFTPISIFLIMIGFAGLLFAIRMMLDLRDAPRSDPNVGDE